jgi:hypothetical protein
MSQHLFTRVETEDIPKLKEEVKELKAELATVKNQLKEVLIWLNLDPGLNRSVILKDNDERIFVIGLFIGKVPDVTFSRIY